MRKELNSVVTKDGKVFIGKIVGENKNYKDPQSASMHYEKLRSSKLAEILYPEDEYPEGFKDKLQILMRNQNPVQMQVWHNKEKCITYTETGLRVATTWENMCNFSRRFICAEMYQCIEVLKRCTPNEVWNKNEFVRLGLVSTGDITTDILYYFNEHIYPEIEKCVSKIQEVLDGIEEQVCKPLRDEINANLKVMMQIPVGERIEFIKGKERRM